MIRRLTLSALAALVLLALPAPSSAQTLLSTGASAGMAFPTGDLGDFYDSGYAVAGRLGVGLLFAQAYVQGGWTRFPEKGSVVDSPFGDDAFNAFHGGIGGRAVLGLISLGLNLNLYGGDVEDEDYGIVPEVGVGLGPLRLLGDYKVNGEVKWMTLRGELSF